MRRRSYSNSYSKFRRDADRKLRIKRKSPNWTNNSFGTIYGLFATDEPDKICYVGATTKPKPRKRLNEHKHGQTSKKVWEWIKEVKNRGAEIDMEVLEHYPLKELSPAEAAWTLYFQESGNLLNSGIRSSHFKKLF